MKIYVYNSPQEEVFRSCVFVMMKMKFLLQNNEPDRGLLRAVRESDASGIYSLLDVQISEHGQGIRLLVMSNSFSGDSGSFFQANNFETEFADMFIETLQPSGLDNAFRIRDEQPVFAYH